MGRPFEHGQPAPWPQANGIDIASIIDESMRVRDLLGDPLYVAHTSRPVGEVVEAMRAQEFDVIGVKTRPDGPTDRYVERASLTQAESVWRASKPLLASMAVEKSMPLVKLLEILREREFVFVLDDDQARFILNRSDITKPQVSLTVLSYLIALEQALLPLAVDRIGSGWFACLGDGPRQRALATYQAKASQRAQLGLEGCLYFSDVMALTQSAPDLLSDLGWTGDAFRRLTERMALLRNDLAHGGTVLDRKNSTPDDVLRTFGSIRALAKRAVALAAQIESRWEAYVDTLIVSTTGADVFAGPGSTAWPFSDEAVVISAANPGGRSRPPDENQEAHARLQGELERESVHVVEVQAQSRNGRWREAAFLATGLPPERALQMARDRGQSSYFALSDAELQVIRVRSLSDRLEGQVVARRDRDR